MKRKTVSALCLVLFLLLIFLCYFLFIGEPIDGAQMAYTITPSGQDLILTVQTSDSGIALRGWKLRQEDSILYISAKKVPVSPFHSGSTYQAIFDPDIVTEVYLGGRLVWSAD